LIYSWCEQNSFTWLLTLDIAQEYIDIAHRLGVRRAVIGRLMNLLKQEAQYVIVREPLELSPDPKDDCVCQCAESGDARFIVTLNPKDFPQSKLRAKVVSPDRLLKLVRPGDH